MRLSSPSVRQERRTYVIGDVHGHRAELEGALLAQGLLDDEGDWAGGENHVWFLGDFVDRGPDGVGVISLVMKLAGQAAETGGMVDTLLGNHEILLMGMHRFGDTDVPSDFGPRSFARSWEINGGMRSDQEALTADHLAWLADRQVVTVVDDHLLMHSDTIEYLQWGATAEEINANVREVLHSENLTEWWECWRRMTTRYSFRGPQGQEVAEQLLDILGGKQVVHGHSVIADQLGILPAQVEAPYEYAGGKVLGVDGGLFVGGPCLVVPLPYTPED
ncbi:MAG: metallophosphoesterase [Kibdelosporangium sp.]